MPKKAARKNKKAAKQSKEQLTIAILERGKKLIAKGWTRGDMFKTKSGAAVDVTHPNICRVCAMGAVYKAAKDLTGIKDNEVFHFPSAHKAITTLQALAGGSVAWFNDEQPNKKPVLALFDSAIANLEAQ